LPTHYSLVFGKGTVLRDGKEAVILGYGPILLHEALVASEILEKEGIGLKVINAPWLNRIQKDWLEEVVGNSPVIFALDNHFLYGGLGDLLLNTVVFSDSLRAKRFHKLGIASEYPACGTPQEALKYHGLDGESLAKRIKDGLKTHPTWHL
jgi:transketolase